MSGSAFHRLKRLVGFETVEDGSYRCQACEAEFEVQYHVCPECGGFSVERA